MKLVCVVAHHIALRRKNKDCAMKIQLNMLVHTQSNKGAHIEKVK
jgi:hypothetical protein